MLPNRSCAGEIKIVGLLVLSTFLLGEWWRPIALRQHATAAAHWGPTLAMRACNLCAWLAAAAGEGKELTVKMVVGCLLALAGFTMYRCALGSWSFNGAYHLAGASASAECSRPGAVSSFVNISTPLTDLDRPACPACSHTKIRRFRESSMQPLVVSLTADSSSGKASLLSSKALPRADSRPPSGRAGSTAMPRASTPSIAVLRA